MAKEELYKRHFLGANSLLKTLMGEIVGKYSLEVEFCKMYSLIIKTQPDFLSALSDE